ncbi:cadmium-translocating P-type ATPase [Nostocaceae cyanobacterium CENA369]|uniref:Copper-exporting P-type ATPase n=1 Tax=Dendronalium phyllosphericum CENA369 TaxID=1725256 RepID=A0A8J7I719_9NOST|nr:heavy metal translocating P-type ATPase [Dendronalium phyllosphericum]MBH8576749.1 cadmium-translocating P-type ATPase [Dendronalium phyllosphericum CENA369]
MSQSNSLKTQTLQVSGMDCGSCAQTIAASLQQLNGVMEASVSFATGRVKVSYDPNLLSEAEIKHRIAVLGYTVDASPTKTLQVQISGMDCGSCAKTIEVGLQQISGVNEASVSFATGRSQISYNPQQVSETTIHERIQALGYTVEHNSGSHSSHHHDSCNHEHDHDHHHEHVQEAEGKSLETQKPAATNWKFWITNRRGQSVILAGIGLCLGLVTQYLALPIWLVRAFYGIGIVVAGYPIARAGLFELRLRRADMNLLMTISVIGAVILGDWFEAALVVFLFSLGTTLQVFTFGRTRNAIQGLMDLTPPTATVKRNHQEVTVAVESIRVGEILTIRPGQRVALDGVVVSGTSAIDQSPITGESIPEDKAPGDIVFAGTLNQTGFLSVKVTHTVSDTTVAKIIHLVEEAQSSRAPTQQWVDRFAEIYTPIVILSAIAIVLIPPLVFAQPLNIWLYRALVLLVIACPCALVISTPVSIVSAIGAATRQGVLFKGGHALETAGHLTSLAFDKTGTLTQGQPVVQKVYNLGEENTSFVLSIAASLEQQSEHPLAKAIVATAKEQRLNLENIENFTAYPGRGIAAQIDENLYFVGNRRLFADFDIALSTTAESLLVEIENLGQTTVLVGNSDKLLGIVALADGLRLEAAEAIRLLQRLGMRHLTMLTGDRTAVAKQIAQQIEITDYQAELLPEDKLQVIQQLRQSGVVGMVGDGINDAPALAAADISFAVGGIDIALETADVVLVGSDLRKLSYAVNLSRRTVSVIQQNVVFSLVTKGLFLLLGTFGFVGLAIAVLADTGTSLLVTANGMRLFRENPRAIRCK